MLLMQNASREIACRVLGTLYFLCKCKTILKLKVIFKIDDDILKVRVI